MFDAIERNNIKHVLLVSRWAAYILGSETGNQTMMFVAPEGMNRQQFFKNHLEHLIQRLQQQGVTLWLFEQVPVFVGEIPLRLTKQRMLGKDISILGRDLENHQQRQKVVTDVFADLAGQHPNVHRLDPTPYLCSLNSLCRMGEGDEPWYTDSNHLSIAGALKVKPAFDKMVSEIQQQHVSELTESINDAAVD